LTSEPWDVLHDPGPPEAHWSTDNVGEAVPGVLSPLAWSLVEAGGNRVMREVAFRTGAFSRHERHHHPAIFRPFYGRVAIRVEYMAMLGDRMPGSDGRAAVAGLLGRVPETMRFDATRRRYPVIALKTPYALLTSPRRVRASTAVTDAWWRAQITRLPGLDVEATRRVLADGARRYEENLVVHTLCVLALVQPLLTALTALVAEAGAGDVGELTGAGGAEMAILTDLWEASRGRLRLDEVIANHGFHGPFEGEVSSRVWREDPEPLRRIIARYTELDDGQDPAARARTAQAELPARQRALLGALPARRRPAAQMLLSLAARHLHLRGIGKRAFLQALDVTRAAARKLAHDLELDTFHLTLDELIADTPAMAADLAARRSDRRAQYLDVTIPTAWQGTPVPRAAPEPPADTRTLTGVGVSAGTVEGRVRVVTDPAFTDVENGEILVSATTDPSWVSIMYVSAALVVDIGGPMSHAAMVARELGIPCVVNTRVGTGLLHTGDLVRVDGQAGIVEVLRPA
jgi:phosphohistidine swiveling domain-containing protein